MTVISKLMSQFGQDCSSSGECGGAGCEQGMRMNE